MKNINVLPTEKPSCKLQKTKHGNFFLSNEIKLYSDCINQNIYITSDEEIKEGVDQWYLDKVLNRPYNSGGAQYSSKQDVIIMTTDQDLIKDGGQAIDDEFLEWFVANPSCEKVEVEESNLLNTSRTYLEVEKYKIIIPKEESKQHLPLNQNKMKEKAEMTREELIALGWVKKQSTAVEFLEQELDKNFEIKGNSFLFDKILKQAKEMEKEKKIEFACQVAESSAMKYIQGKTTRMIAEELLTA
jgi:hypothetical protein